MNRLILLIFCLIWMISCQNEPKIIENTQVFIDIKVNQPILLSLYYVNDTADIFDEQKRVNFDIKNSDTWTKAKFELPTTSVPQRLMLTFGRDTLLQKVELKDFNINSQNKMVNFENKDLHLFFHDFEYIQHQNNGFYTTFPENRKFNPYLKTTPFFSQRLKIEYGVHK